MPHDADDAAHTVEITNAALTILRAMNSNVDSARGLAIMSKVMCRDNPAARTALAITLLELARELSPRLPILRIAQLNRRLH
jgi:hypothetical protein